MEIPKVEKVILNMGVGEAVGNPKALDAAVNDMTIIAGPETGSDPGQKINRRI